MQTDYPWNGTVKINIDPSKKSKFNIYLRIPGWANGEPVPGDLYKFAGYAREPVSVKVNGKEIQYRPENGFAVIEREWKKGDIIEYTIPMPVNYIVAGSQLQYDAGRIALQRGPVLYCMEGADNNGEVWNLIVPASTKFTTKEQQVLTEPVIALQGEVLSAKPSADGISVVMEKRTVTAIPYYTWANRGANEMQVWLPSKITDVKIGYPSKYKDGGTY